MLYNTLYDVTSQFFKETSAFQLKYYVQRGNRQRGRENLRTMRRMRDVCLPVPFHKIRVESSNEGFDLLESILKSNLHRYVVSFEYVALMLLNPSKDPGTNRL
jgi:hypothetical protein